MTTVITQVQNTNYINNAEFVRVTVDDTAYTFSNSYKAEVFSASTFTNQLAVSENLIVNLDPTHSAQVKHTVYSPLGGLLSISGHQRDLTVTSYDTSISLVGVDQTKIGLVIDAGLKGAKVEIWRGFYNAQSILISNPVLRYTGIVTSYVIDEQLQDRDDTFILNLHCSSYKKVLENRRSGRNTTSASWKQFNPDDVSMDNVASLANAKFNFGQKLA